MTLVAQTTVRYVALAVSVLLLVGAASTFVSFAFYLQLTREAVFAVAHSVEAHQLDIRGLSRSAAQQRALRVSEEVARPPVTVTFSDAAGAPLAGTGRTPANSLAVLALATSAFALGLRPMRVPLAGGAGSAVIAPDAGSVAARMRAYSLAMLPPGVAAILLAILLGRQVAKGAVRPMLDVTRSLDALAAGEFTPRSVSAASTTEVRALAEAYDRAVRHVAAAFAERRETEMHIRQFIADAGHQLRTPLTIIMGYVDLLDGGIVREPEMRARVYENMRAEGKRMRGLVDKLIFLARLDRPESEDPPEAIDVASLAA